MLNPRIFLHSSDEKITGLYYCFNVKDIILLTDFFCTNEIDVKINI